MGVLLFLFYAATSLAVILLSVAGYFAFVTRRLAAQAERLVPSSGRFVDTSAGRVHYVEAGQGPAILFIHGLGGQLHDLRHPLFGRLGSAFRLVAVDRPGSGYSERSPWASGSLAAQARAVIDVMDALGLDRPLLVGHSFGGAVALAVALDHPERVSALALISPLTHLEETLRPEFARLFIRSPFKRWLIANTFGVPTAMKYAPQTLAFVFGPQRAPNDYFTEGGGMLGLRPSHFLATASDLVAVPDELGALEARYGELAVPVGMLFGDADRVLDHRVHGLATAARIPGIDLEIAEGVGHMPQYADPARVVAFIRRMAARAFAAPA